MERQSGPCVIAHDDDNHYDDDDYVGGDDDGGDCIGNFCSYICNITLTEPSKARRNNSMVVLDIYSQIDNK